MTPECKDDLGRLEDAVRRQSQEEQAAKAISTARTKLVLGRDAKSVFFATLALRLEAQCMWEVETLATDGKMLVYNPDFVLSLSEPERVALVAHEVLHNVLGHHTRRGHRNLEQWNIAADLAVNPMLREAMFTLPAGGCYPGEGEYKDMPQGLSAEEYYNLLQKPGAPDDQGEGQPDPDGEPGDDEGQGQGEGQGNPCPDPGKCGGVMDAGDGSPAAQRESQAEWEVAVAQANEAAKQRGTMPGGLARLVQNVLAPKVDWREVLREFVSRLARNDYSWTPPNRRFIHQGLYLPGMRSEELGDVTVAVDTSGSIGEKELSRFASELQAILEGFDCTLTILYHDSIVQHVQQWKSSDGPLVLEPKGGGGTSHIPVFDHIQASGESPTCLVCLTDLYSSFPDKAPDYPVLWASTVEGMKGPFGTTLEVSL